MKALISTIEPRQSGFRVAQVVSDNSIFGVSDAMFWVDCNDDVVPDQFWYDPADQTIKAVPPPPEPEEPAEDQPQTEGTQEV